MEGSSSTTISSKERPSCNQAFILSKHRCVNWGDDGACCPPKLFTPMPEGSYKGVRGRRRRAPLCEGGRRPPLLWVGLGRQQARQHIESGKGEKASSLDEKRMIQWCWCWIQWCWYLIQWRCPKGFQASVFSISPHPTSPNPRNTNHLFVMTTNLNRRARFWKV